MSEIWRTVNEGGEPLGVANMIPNDADDRCTYVSMKDMALTPPRREKSK